MEKAKQNNKRNWSTLYWIIGMIIVIATFLLIEHLQDKRLREEGIETVGIVDKYYWEYDHGEGKARKQYTVKFHFFEIETQKWIHRSLTSVTDDRYVPQGKYRVRYLKGKAFRSSQIYSYEPIDDSTYKAFLKQAKTIE